MVKLFFSFLLVLWAGGLNAQSLDSLKIQRDSLRTLQKSYNGRLAKIGKALDSIRNEIEINSGWRINGHGTIGLNFSRTENWVGNANPNAFTSNLSVATNLSANTSKKKSFWRNATSLNLAWQGQDVNTAEGDQAGLLSERTVDIFTFSSLYGYRFGKSLAFSNLIDLNTSVFNFLNIGSLDFSTGLTWKPKSVNNLTVVFHALSYHVAYTAREDIQNGEAFGMKFKISYNTNMPFGLKWTTNLNSFIPYTNPREGTPDLFEYTWINNLSYKLWKVFGFGLNVGIRKADFEINRFQWFNTFGMTVSI